MASAPFPRRLLPLALAAAGLLAGANASAVTLMQAYEAALKNDPAYRAAMHQADAGRENRILGRSNLLPNVSGAYNGSKNNTTQEIANREIPQRYISRSATVQVRQPLFSMDAWARYKQGVAQSASAEAVFESQSQEVIVRVVQAYVEVLFKEEQVRLAQAERDVLAEQRKVNDLLFKKGEGTRTDALETQARLDLAEAQLLDAQDSLVAVRDELANVIGQDPGELSRLRPGLRVDARDLLDFEEWKKTALDRNPDIRAMSQNVESARQEINKQRAGHIPRVDLVGTYGKTASDSLTTIDQDNKIRSIGFQMNIPIFSGGATSASTRQAAASHEKVRADREAQIDKTLLELRRNFNQVTSSVPRIEALEKAVESARLLITATEQSIKGGVRINLDLLTAQRQLYTAQRDLAQARYGYMLSSLRLRAAAGTLGAEDLKLLSANFE